MTRIAALVATAVAATAMITAPVAQARSKVTGEEKLAKMLEGREAGKPVSCIPHWETRDSKVIDKTAIVYGRGNTIYVNRPMNADRLDDDDVLVTTMHTSQLCKLDTVQLRDRGPGFFYRGFVGLEEFVPYRKIDGKVAVAD
ncbi:hypothetical protein B2G71_15995 [Novosphingobium sp. PC22D]|uniref:hypothetical protein n=1 Tax=Novosphingobium sp. PC22D TaxID=1962403 RepID=UPI000BF15D99|nr:hypothetical protein [Novosphingobium sp. PC22D]PEQ11625.1 hypothetical protein B2G71_15995 [Novosphingobium sp. PC22D]